MACSVGVIFGGESREHEVSVKSAEFIIKALSEAGYQVIPIGITKAGRWILIGDVSKAFTKGTIEDSQGRCLVLIPGAGKQGFAIYGGSGEVDTLFIDVVFPVLHGPLGEDGTVQGLLEMIHIPYVGGGVLASSVGMDKTKMKSIFLHAGLPTVKYEVIENADWERKHEDFIARVESSLNYPMFVKPANLGSSVGVTKVHSREELVRGIQCAFGFDRRILIEEGLQNIHEVECSVLGNDNPMASTVGEIVPAREFYDYEAKYIDLNSKIIIPAPLEESVVQKIQDLAIKAFKAIDCSGMARVDFFVHKGSNEIIVNEINTIPGFTPISMYPKLLEKCGISFTELVKKLVQLAEEKHRNRTYSAN